MRFFSLQCTCGCGDPLVATSGKEEKLIMFRSRQLAELEASFVKDDKGNPANVGEFEVKPYEEGQ